MELKKVEAVLYDYKNLFCVKSLKENDFKKLCDKLIVTLKEDLNLSLYSNYGLEEKKLLGEICSNICEHGYVPEIDGPSDEESRLFESHRGSQWGLSSLKAMTILMEGLSRMDCKPNDSHLQNIVASSFILCLTFSFDKPWSDEKLNVAAKYLLQQICNCCSVDRNSDHRYVIRAKYLPSIYENGILQPVFTILQTKLNKAKWRLNYSFRDVFVFILNNITPEQVSKNITKFLPPCLLFVDDYSIANQLIGIRCIDIILKSTTDAELNLFGKAEVICHALEQLTYSTESEIVKELYPCLLSILRVLETTEQRERLSWSKHDKIFQQMLNQMEFEQKLKLRSSYSAQLAPFISQIGIDCLKHSKRLLRIFSNYLESSSDLQETVRKSVLLAFQKFIVEIWPRINYHLEDLLKILFKTLYIIDEIDDQAKQDMVGMIKDCLILIANQNPSSFQKICTDLDFKDMPPMIGKTLDQLVQETA